MPKSLRILCVGIILAAAWGCSEEKKQPENNNAGGGGNPAAAGGAPGGAPPMMAGPGMMAPGMGGAAPGQGAGQAPAAATSSANELFAYIPENLRVAAGLNVAALLAEKSNPAAKELLAPFAPVAGMLGRAGIAAEKIEHLWTGSNRDSGDMIVCVRTKANYDAAAVTAGLGATGESEKIGKARVQAITSNPAYRNAVGFVDAKTLLLGRYDTVAAALKNPKAGGVRAGLEALNQPNAAYWLAGDELAFAQVLRSQGADPISLMAAAVNKPRGFSLGFTLASGNSQNASGSGMMPSGSTPPSGAPPSGAAPASSAPGGGHGSSAPPGSASTMPGGNGAPAADAGPTVEIALGLSFGSEDVAAGIEKQINDAMKLIQQATQGGFPGMQPPGGPAGGHSAPPGAVPAAGAGVAAPAGRAPIELAPVRLPFFYLLQAPGAAPGSAPPASGPGGPAMPGMSSSGMGMPGMGGGAGQSQSPFTVVRTKENLRFAVGSVPLRDGRIGRMLSAAVQATGASAIADGLFEGTLAMTGRGVAGWLAKPEPVKGVRRVGDLRIEAGYSWMTELLPFIGRPELYTQFDFNKTWMDKANQPHARTIIPEFLNPSDPRTKWDGFPYDGLALTHFAGMAGVEDRRNVVAASLPRSDPRAGIFGYDQVARPNEITDGTSNTIMIVGTGEPAGGWVTGGGATIRGARQPYFDPYTGLGSKGTPKPGTFVLFADGSSRFISADIDPEVFKAMCTMHGAEQIDMTKLVTNK